MRARNVTYGEAVENHVLGLLVLHKDLDVLEDLGLDRDRVAVPYRILTQKVKRHLVRFLDLRTKTVITMK
jgi:hypothetical protein